MSREMILPGERGCTRVHCVVCGAAPEDLTLYLDRLSGDWHLFAACHGSVDHYHLREPLLRALHGPTYVSKANPYTTPGTRFMDISTILDKTFPTLLVFQQHTGDVSEIVLVRQAVQRWRELFQHEASPEAYWPRAWSFLRESRVMDAKTLSLPRLRRMDFAMPQLPSAPGAKKKPRVIEEQP